MNQATCHATCRATRRTHASRWFLPPQAVIIPSSLCLTPHWKLIFQLLLFSRLSTHLCCLLHLLWVTFKRLSGCIWWQHSCSLSNLNIMVPPPTSSVPPHLHLAAHIKAVCTGWPLVIQFSISPDPAHWQIHSFWMSPVQLLKRSPPRCVLPPYLLGLKWIWSLILCWTSVEWLNGRN